MESGEGSNNQDGREGRTPPDEQQMRIGRARVSRGVDPEDEGRPLEGAGASSGIIGGAALDNTAFAAGNRTPSSGGGGTDAVDLGPRVRPWAEPAPSGPGPVRCHFLRSVGPDGRLTDAQKTAVPTHRCAAFGDPLPLSLRQQELVCLQRVHVSCPRYVRGTLLANENEAQPTGADQRGVRIPLLTVVGVVLVILALGVIFSGVLGFGPLGSGTPARSLIAAISEAPTHTPVITSRPTASPTVRSSATAVATASHAASPSTRPTSTPVASASWPPGATASRMNLVVPCTDQASCYVYIVRGPGPNGNGSNVADTLAGVAQFFGVDVAKVQQMNQFLGGGSTIAPGDKLKIPPPTR